ncbi:MAG TPA: DUF1330 domain-containing protein [Myxococcales bacterium]|nr:hypothetical protein [Myxococcales bacterium]HAN30708.1 DUF1330 domain-containing protein [Myxococcales bacterium]
MPALLSVTVKVKNPDRLKEYISQVPGTMAPFSAKMIGRGKVAKSLDGERSHHIEALFEFPDAAAIDGWYNSDAYQAIIPLRNQVCEMTLAVLDPF